MKKAIDRKKDEISMLIIEFKDLVDLHKDKVSEYFKNEFYFKRMKEDLEELGHDFEELKKFYFNLGVEFRRFVIEYDINHDFISENTINIFLKQEPFIYLLSEKPDDEPIDYRMMIHQKWIINKKKKILKML